MGRPAARITDTVAHPMPAGLSPGPGSDNVFIGKLKAWRGIPHSAVSGLKIAKKAADKAIEAAKKATQATIGTPAYASAKAAETATQTATLGQMGGTILTSAAGADIHTCATPLSVPVAPHGPGVVITGSKTVMINGLPACRQQDTILEAIGPTNKITKGCMTVKIGG